VPTTRDVENRPFNFRLERVRSVREAAEDQAREDLAASLALRLRGEGMLKAAEAELHAARDARLATGTRAVASGTDLVAAQAYVEHAERRRQARLLDLDRCEAEVETRRAALVERARERQALERLKEKQRKDHEIESARIAGAALDEMSLNMHRRRAEAA
jgi:flagellar export protein FliJ